MNSKIFLFIVLCLYTFVAHTGENTIGGGTRPKEIFAFSSPTNEYVLFAKADDQKFLTYYWNTQDKKVRTIVTDENYLNDNSNPVVQSILKSMNSQKWEKIEGIQE